MPVLLAAGLSCTAIAYSEWNVDERMIFSFVDREGGAKRNDTCRGGIHKATLTDNDKPGNCSAPSNSPTPLVADCR